MSVSVIDTRATAERFYLPYKPAAAAAAAALLNFPAASCNTGIVTNQVVA